MASRLCNAFTRIVLLCLAAAIGYVAVYVPLMILLFDKRRALVFWPILFLALWSAAKFARWADRRLPQPYLAKAPADDA